MTSLRNTTPDSSRGRYMPLDDLDDLIDEDPLELPPEPEPEGRTSRFLSHFGKLPRINIKRLQFKSICIPKWMKVHAVVFDIILSIVCLLAVCGICVGLGWFTVKVKKPAPVIDKSYNAFKIPNHQASLNYQALTTVEKNNRTSFSPNALSLLKHQLHLNGLLGRRRKRSSHYLDPMPHVKVPILRKRRSNRDQNRVITAYTQYYIKWKMQVVFLAKGGDENVFTKERLEQIHKIEQKIITHPKYEDFCYIDYHSDFHSGDPAVNQHSGCAPLNSLLTYFFPTVSDGHVFYDGYGDNIDNISSALNLAMKSDDFYYYVDDKASGGQKRSKFLRTEVLFGAPVKGFDNVAQLPKEQFAKFRDFVVTYIDTLSDSSTDQVHVLYGGNEIFDYEVESTFWADVKLAGYALLAITILMLLLTFSLWLTFCGILSIVLSFPLAFFFYRMAFNIRGLGILNGAAAFVIIGIGVDDVFVFINIFRQATHLTSSRARTIHTIIVAGKATFFTSFTTAAAFAANMASSIPAIHEFGLFMCLIVSCCWMTVILMMPPALYIWDSSMKRCETYLTSFIRCSGKLSKLSLPGDIAKFVESNHDNSNGDHSNSNGHVTTGYQREAEDEEDVPMLTGNMSLQLANDSEDEEMLMPDYGPEDFTPEEVPSPQKQTFHLGGFLQGLLYYGLALPVIKIRWIILGVSIVVLGISIGLITQLHPSTKPPQFFKEDTNMQQLLDLKSKFSVIDTVSCSHCSGIYNVGPGKTGPVVTASKPPVTTLALPTTHASKTSHVTTKPVQSTRRPSTTTVPTKKQTDASKTSHVTTKPDQSTRRPPSTSVPTKKITEPKKTTPGKKFTKGFTKTTWWPTVHHTTAKPPSTQRPPDTQRPPNNPETNNPVVTTAKPPSDNPSHQSVPTGYDPCKNQDCTGTPVERPALDTGATVFVVFGIKDFKITNQDDVGHVMEEIQGKVEFDEKFSRSLNMTNFAGFNETLRSLCKICKLVAQNQQLVNNRTAECFSDQVMKSFGFLFQSMAECTNLPKPKYVYGKKLPASSMGGFTKDGQALLWLAFAFESTTVKGKSYFDSYKDYLAWEAFLKELKDKNLDKTSSLQTMFQTSDFWTDVMMEVIAVSSAIYGLVLSMLICMAAVAVFTQHLLLLLIIFISILEMVCLVVAIFYMAGWEIGGVEAISLSILVGSSVDYCVHLVEGYILAGKACPPAVAGVPSKSRQWRTSASVSYIGVSIVSSALTTIMAAVPLTQTTIQPFAKFGQILAINTSVCVLYSMTVCAALLSTAAPAYFKPSWKSVVKAIIGTTLTICSVVLCLFIITKTGTSIPGPSGEPLFSG